MKKLIFLFFLILCAKAKAIQPDKLGIINPSYQGSGCPEESVSLTLSPDNSSLSVLFDSFRSEIDSSTGVKQDQKNCQLSFTLHVPKGKSMAILAVDLRGFNYLEEGAKALITADFIFPNNKGPRKVYNFQGPLNEDFFLHAPEPIQNINHTPCGKDQHIKINTSIRLSMIKNRKTKEKKKFPKPIDEKINGLSTIESFDAMTGNGPDIGLTYKIISKDCQ